MKGTTEFQEFSIDTVSKSTGIIPSTIRYWDKIGLISARRCTTNNYRKFTQKNIDEILIIQALKLAVRARGEKYAIEQIRKEMVHIDPRYLANIENVGDVPSVPILLQLIKICKLPVERYFNLEILCEDSEQRQRTSNIKTKGYLQIN